MLDQTAITEIPGLVVDASVVGYDVITWNYVTDTGFALVVNRPGSTQP